MLFISRSFLLLVLFCFHGIGSFAQLKYLVEDFEGFAAGSNDLKANGLFSFGHASASAVFHTDSLRLGYSGRRCLSVDRPPVKKNKQGHAFGGWGKGVGMFVELDKEKDFFCFYFLATEVSGLDSIKVELQEDDNASGNFEKAMDDAWVYSFKPSAKKSWQLINIPLTAFRDANFAGDGQLNIGYKKGKLVCLIMSFVNEKKSAVRKKQSVYFDFLCFSEGKLQVSNSIFRPLSAGAGDFCNLGAWSKEGNTANFVEIAKAFETNFGNAEKKLGIVHFFQPFAVDGGTQQNHYPSKERINNVLKSGYIPMITLENRFVNLGPTAKQPNLYSIVEGHFDSFFIDWAKQIKEVDGTVLLRILHEFNGDWYPWCLVNNDRNPALFIEAYRRIHNIFKKQNVDNVKFIWCPNSMSLPQESWNYVLDAYPGDAFVDYVGLDIYNGAGKSETWRSFRKEGIEMYYTATKHLSQKPLLICETASRERGAGEPKNAQNKAEWIEQMSDVLQTDMSKFRLLTWFNDKETFRVNSSNESRDAFMKHIVKCSYFKSGTQPLSSLIKKK